MEQNVLAFKWHLASPQKNLSLTVSFQEAKDTFSFDYCPTKAEWESKKSGLTYESEYSFFQRDFEKMLTSKFTQETPTPARFEQVMAEIRAEEINALIKEIAERTGINTKINRTTFAKKNTTENLLQI